MDLIRPQRPIINSYKSFKRYTSWGYKTLDSIVKGIRLYEEYTNLELLNELYKLDNEILNDSEKLEAYMEELKIEVLEIEVLENKVLEKQRPRNGRIFGQ